MPNSLIPLDQIKRLVTRLAIGIAVLITLAPPMGYLAYAWTEAMSGVEHHSKTQAILVDRYVTRNIEVWQVTRERLLESLTGFAMPGQRTLVIDHDQQTLGELGPSSLKAPVIAHEAPFYEFGEPAGVVRVEVSFDQAIRSASVILLFSGFLGVMVFAPLRRIPLAALTDSMQQLERSEERFRRLTELSSDWYWEQDKQHRFTKISAGARRSGFDVDAALGHPLWEVATGLTLEAWAEHRKTLDARASFRDFEYGIPSVNEEEIWFSCSGEPTFDDQGHFAGYHGTARDQSLRHRTENILRNQKEVLNEMVERRTADLQAALNQATK